MNNGMVERFNVAGALLVKLFGHPDAESDDVQRQGGARARHRHRAAMYARFFFIALLLTAALATALVYGWGGVLAVHGALDVGTVVALAAYLNRLYGPLTALSNIKVDIMTALVSFERVFEVLDLPPMVAEKPDAAGVPRGPARIEFDHVASPTRRQEVSLASLESMAVPNDAPGQEVLHDVSFTAEPGQLVALVGPSGAGKTTISQLVPRLYDVSAGAVRINGVDVRDASLDSLRDDRRGHPGRAPVPRHDPRQPALREARRRPTTRSTRRCARPRSCRWSSRCRTASTPSSATAATGCRAARSSGWPSPGCCSRRRTSWCWTRPPRTWTRSPRSPCSAPSRRPCRAHLARHRAPALDGARGRPDPGAAATGASSSAAATRSCWQPAACTPSCTARSFAARTRAEPARPASWRAEGAVRRDARRRGMRPEPAASSDLPVLADQDGHLVAGGRRAATPRPRARRS